MNNKDNMPPDFIKLIEIIEKKKHLINEFLQGFREELQMIRTHPVCSPPESLVRGIEKHIRDHCIALSRWGRFSKMISSKNPQILTDAEISDIGEQFKEAIDGDRALAEEWQDLKYEIDSWNESMLELESMLGYSSYSEEDYYDDYSEDEDEEDFFADGDEGIY